MGWTDISEDLFETLTLHLERRQLKALHLVNHHYRYLVASQLELLTPRRVTVEHHIIFPQLQTIDLSRCWNDVNDTWLAGLMQALGQSSAKLKVLDLSRCHGVTDRGVASVAMHLTDLEVLNLSGCRSPSPIDEVGYSGVTGQTLNGLHKLHSLSLRWNPVTETSFQVIAELTKLTYLDLGECSGFSDSACLLLPQLKNLKILNLERTLISIDGLLPCLRLTGLISLSLSNCAKIEDTCFRLLPDLSSITDLNLSKLDHLTDAGLIRLVSLPKLSRLNLLYCCHLQNFWMMYGKWNIHTLNLADGRYWVTDETLDNISKQMPKLRILNLQNCQRITTAGLAHLCKLHLEVLDLSLCCFTVDQDLEHLSKMIYLKEINLTYCSEVSDIGLAKLSKLSSLKKLILSCCSRITSNGIYSIAPLHRTLQFLELAACHGIAASTLLFISETFVNLRALNLSWLSVKDAHFRSLKNLKYLNKVEINSCHELSEDVLKEFWYLEGISYDIP